MKATSFPTVVLGTEVVLCRDVAHVSRFARCVVLSDRLLTVNAQYSGPKAVNSGRSRRRVRDTPEA